MESVAISMDKEVRRAAMKFEAEFEFSKMETMMHRFPAALGDAMSSRYPSMVVPRLVAIGPYHHGKTKDVKKMEEVKNVAVHYLCKRIGVTPDEARQKVLAVADDALGKYHDVEGTMKKSYFADMMLRDACFLLLYMDAYNRSYGEKEDHKVNRSIRRFLFSRRESINSDIMLLENQLPWLVIQTLVGCSQDHIKKDLLDAVGKFVAAMGNSFKIRESCDELVAYVWDDDKNPPAHLLVLLRRHTTEKPADDKTGHCSSSETTDESVGRNTTVVLQLDDDDDDDGNTSSQHLRRPLIPAAAAAAVREEKPQPAVTSLSALSPMELEEIGIQLKPIPTAAFSEMDFKEGRLLFLSRLTLAPLSLSDTRASFLVNMAALEVCTASRFGDHYDRTAVCSYLALLAFMVETGNVRRLRSKGLLHGQHSDGDMLAFFNAVAKHLPRGRRFALLMAGIEEYKEKRRIRTTVYRWGYNHYMTIIWVVSVIVTFIALYQGLRSLIQN